MGPMFLPPVVSKIGGSLAALNIGTLGGGTNWPGACYDPETHIVFAPAANAGVSPIGLVEPPAGFSDIRYEGRRRSGIPHQRRSGLRRGADAPKVSGHDAGQSWQGRRARCARAQSSGLAGRCRRPRNVSRRGTAARQAALRRSLGHQSRHRRD